MAASVCRAFFAVPFVFFVALVATPLFADAPTDEQVAGAVAKFQAAVKQLSTEDAKALARGRLEAARNALQEIHVFEMTSDQILLAGRSGMLSAMGWNGWTFTPQQQAHIQDLVNAGWKENCWPYGGGAPAQIRLYELSRAETAEGAKACIASMYFLPPVPPNAPEAQSRVTEAAVVSWLRRTCEHAGLAAALNSGSVADLGILFDPKFTEPRLVARCTKAIERLERVLTAALPPQALARFDRIIAALERAPDGNWQTWQRMRLKSQRLVTAALDHVADNDAAKPELSTFRNQLTDLAKRIAALDEKAGDDGPEGANAAVDRLRFPPVALDKDAVAAQRVDLRARAREMLLRALSHPQIGAKLRGGDGTLFDALAQYDAPVVDELFPAVLKLAPSIPDDGPLSLALSAGPVLDLLARHPEADEAARTKLRERLVSLLGAAKQKLAANDPARERLDRLEQSAGSPFARGTLIGKPCPMIVFNYSTWGEGPWLGFSQRPVNIEDMRGRVTVLYFWEPASSASIEGLSWLRDLEKRYAGCPVSVLAVVERRRISAAARTDGDGGDVSRELEWLEHRLKDKSTPRSVVASYEPVFDSFGVGAAPKLAILDPRGVVRFAGLSLESESAAESATAAKIDSLLREFELTLPGTPESKTADIDQRIDHVNRQRPRMLEELMRGPRGDKAARRKQLTLDLLGDRLVHEQEIDIDRLTVSQLMRLRPVFTDRSSGFTRMKESLRRMAAKDGLDGMEAACGLLTMLTGPISLGQRGGNPMPDEAKFVTQVLHDPRLADALRRGRGSGVFTFVGRTHPQTISACLPDLLALADVIPDDTSIEHVTQFRQLFEALKRAEPSHEKLEPLRNKLLAIARARQADLAAGKAAPPHDVPPLFFKAQIGSAIEYLEAAGK